MARGRGRPRARAAGRSAASFDPLPPAEAAAALDELVALYRAGLRSPLPLPVKTAAAYADRRNHSDTPTAREGAEREWLSDRFPGEQEDAEHVLLYGDRAPLTVLTTQRPAARRGRRRLARRRDRPVRAARPPALGPAARRGDAGADVTIRLAVARLGCRDVPACVPMLWPVPVTIDYSTPGPFTALDGIPEAALTTVARDPTELCGTSGGA